MFPVFLLGRIAGLVTVNSGGTFAPGTTATPGGVLNLPGGLALKPSRGSGPLKKARLMRKSSPFIVEIKDDDGSGRASSKSHGDKGVSSLPSREKGQASGGFAPAQVPYVDNASMLDGTNNYNPSRFRLYVPGLGTCSFRSITGSP